jgi:serine/threonine-protein kinase
MKAIAKNPADRFQDAYEMRQQITYCLKNLRSTTKNINKKEKFNADETKVMKRTDFAFLNNSENNNKKNNNNNKTYDQQKNVDQKKSKNEKANNDKNMDSNSKKAAVLSDIEKNNSKNKTEKNNNQKNKYKKPLFIIAGILLFFLISIGGLLLFFNQYTNVPIVQVPDIEDKSLIEARKMASEVGLNLLENKERVFSEELAENYVVTQQPTSGERIKQSRPLNITVSKGPQLIEIPNFVDNSLREALLELDNLSLSSGDIQYIFRLSEAPGTVINQIPAAGAEVEKGSEITLFVSRGERDISVKMPNLTGLQQSEAITLIREKGLNVGQISVESSNRFADGQVISQSVRAGEYLPKGIAVDFMISKGAASSSTEDFHSNRISINVTGSERREVRIIIEDDNGEEQVYQAIHEPGDNIVRDIQSQGNTELRIYFDNQLIKSENFGG